MAFFLPRRFMIILCDCAPRACRQGGGASYEYAAFFLPRRTIACERVLAEEGVAGDVTAGEYPLGFIPFDADLLSLEAPSAFRVRAHLHGRGWSMAGIGVVWRCACEGWWRSINQRIAHHGGGRGRRRGPARLHPLRRRPALARGALRVQGARAHAASPCSGAASRWWEGVHAGGRGMSASLKLVHEKPVQVVCLRGSSPCNWQSVPRSVGLPLGIRPWRSESAASACGTYIVHVQRESMANSMHISTAPVWRAAGSETSLGSLFYILSGLGFQSRVLHAAQELAAEGDRSSLWDVARALTSLQAGFGGARVVKGKGNAAAAVRALLLRMRQEAGAEGPIVGAAPTWFQGSGEPSTLNTGHIPQVMAATVRVLLLRTRQEAEFPRGQIMRVPCAAIGPIAQVCSARPAEPPWKKGKIGP